MSGDKIEVGSNQFEQRYDRVLIKFEKLLKHIVYKPLSHSSIGLNVFIKLRFMKFQSDWNKTKQEGRRDDRIWECWNNKSDSIAE